jgi:serralysin
MKSKLLSDSGAAFDDAFSSLVSNGIDASSIHGQGPGNAVADGQLEHPTTPTLHQDAVAQATVAGSTVAVTMGGITINLLFDAAAMAAPASFRAGVVQAATLLSASITDRITVNLNIDYAGTGPGAHANPDGIQVLSYSSVRANLINHAAAGDTTYNALPDGPSVHGQLSGDVSSSVDVYNAQLKLWGLLGANDASTDDGTAVFARDIDPNLLGGVALRSLAEALGNYATARLNVFDLFSFDSPGRRMFGIDVTRFDPAYFSLDGGITKLADYGGRIGDPSYFLNTGVQGPNDAFNESYSNSTNQNLSAIDLLQLHVLGFHVAAPVPTAIEVFGSTKLDQIGNYYFLDPASGGFGPSLRSDGAPVISRQFVSPWGTWTPIGAEKLADGTYEVAWNVAGTDQYQVWTTDSFGNFVSSQVFSATSATLGFLEASFHQDVNGDGTIGVVPTVTIEAVGSTGLFQQGNHFYLTNSQGIGFLLSDGGTPVVPGRYGTLVPIAAEVTSTGFYDVAWKDSVTGHFTVWSTDSRGNFVGKIVDNVDGTNGTFETLENTFHQDLNGDGVIGLNSPAIEAFGVTRLDKIGNNYFLDPVAGGSGPSLKIFGVLVVPGLFEMNPIGAEKTANGYDVAFKAPDSDLYSVWSTDNNGNFITKLIDSVAGANTRLQSIETVFHQDLNGDGVIGIRTTRSIMANDTEGAVANSEPFAFRADLGAGSIADSGIAKLIDSLKLGSEFADLVPAMASTDPSHMDIIASLIAQAPDELALRGAVAAALHLHDLL